MVMLKLSAILLAYVLVICQMYSSHAAPSRTSSEPASDQVTLTNHDARRILNAILEEIMQMSSEEQEQHATEENSMVDRAMSKRCTSLSTCVLGKLSQDIHKLQTYPRTDVGAGTPGKK